MVAVMLTFPVLGTMEAAVDILEKAGETFSSRPHFIMG